MHHTIHYCGGDYRIAEVVAEFLEIYIAGHHSWPLAIPAVDHFVKEETIMRIFLFKPVESNFVDQQDIRWSELPTASDFSC